MKRIIFYTFVMVVIVVCIYLYKMTEETSIYLTETDSLSTGMPTLDEWKFKYYSYLGSTNSLEGKFIAANAAYNLAIKYNPYSAQNYLSRGLLKFERAHYKLAISDLNMAEKYHYRYEGDGEEKLDYFGLAMLHFTKARARIELKKHVNKYGTIKKNTIEMDLNIPLGMDLNMALETDLNMALNYARAADRKDLATSISELKNSFLEDIKQN